MPGRLAPASLRWARGVPPPPKQSFPRAPQSPRQGRGLAVSPASRARLPRGRADRAWACRRRPPPPASCWKTSGGGWQAPSSGRRRASSRAGRASRAHWAGWAPSWWARAGGGQLRGCPPLGPGSCSRAGATWPTSRLEGRRGAVPREGE